MKKTGVRNQSEKFIHIKLVTPGYTQETKSVKRHTLSDDQEEKIYRIYDKFKTEVFDVIFGRDEKEKNG